MNKLLSILIPTLPARIEKLHRLVGEITRQVNDYGLQDYIQLAYWGDSGELTIGNKRDRQLKYQALADYIMWWDDDDMPSSNAMPLLVKACRANPDVVTYRGWYVENEKPRQFIIKLDEQDRDDNHSNILYRRPNHICPVRKSIAEQVGFLDMQYNEDGKYAAGIYPFLKNEVHIAENIYTYYYNQATTQTHPNRLANPFKE